jgi:NarL family two-component system sensor histidine kinase YdfH
MKKPNLFSRLFRNERYFELPLFIFLTLVLVGICIWSLFESPVLDSVWEIVLFTVLMGLHIVLYWVSPWVFGHPRWLVAYLILQGLLAFSMVMLSRVIGITLGLYSGLIGLVVGMPVKRIWRILAVGFFLALSLANYLVLTKMGTVSWWILSMVPIVLFVTIYVSMYVRQAEARERAQSLLKDLEVANRQLSEYAAQVEDLTLANERQRMARELHDTLSQGLAGLILQLEAAEVHLEGNHLERVRSILKQSMEKARGTLREARRAIDDLRQPENGNLVEAALKEVERFTNATGIPCEPQIDVKVDVPDLVGETTIRAISEGLTNIARHARATNAILRLSGIEKGLEIEIRDDGVGFDPETVQVGHYGLVGMRERVRLVGGNFNVLSEPGKGTRIVIRFPLENPVRE